MLPESTGLLNFFGIPRFQLQGIAVDEKVGAEHAPSDFPADDAVAYSLMSWRAMGHACACQKEKGTANQKLR